MHFIVMRGGAAACRRPRRLTLALAASLLPAVASAQTTPQPATPQTLEPVEVTGERPTYQPPPTSTPTRTDTPFLLNPQATQVLPRGLIRDQSAQYLQDALRNVAGVQFDFGFNGQALPLFILRGFPSVSMSAQGSMSGSSSVYLDGAKVSGVPVNMANVQAIEVVKGPASVLYGRAEPGGLVNVVTRKVPAAREASIEQTIGSYGLSRTSVEASSPLNAERTLRARVSGSYAKSGSDRDFVEDKLGAVGTALAWVPDTRSQLAIYVDRTDQRYRNDYGVPARGDRPVDLPRERQFNDSPDLSRSRTDVVRAEGEWALGADWKLKPRVVHVRSHTREVDVTPYRIDLATGDDCLAANNELCRYYYFARPDGRYRLDQANVDLIGTVRTGGLTHTLLFGIDAYRSRKEGTTYLQTLAPVNIDVPVLGNTPPLDTSAALSLEREDKVRWTSVYIQDQVAFGNGVVLTAAVRHDRTSAIYAAPGTEPNKESFTTPRLGAVWQFAPNQSIYAQYQDSVAANNGRQATGEALAAERARQIEVGHKSEWFGGSLTSTLAAYELTKRNLADYSLFPVIRTVGKARSRGIEWDVSGEVTSRLALIASYAFTRPVVTEDPTNEGKALANVAKHSGSFWARYSFGPQWVAGGGVFAQGRRQGDIGNTFQLPGYARFDAMVAYRFSAWGARSTLQLNVDNLTDKLYFTGSHQFVQDWIKPGPPRTFKAMLRIDI